MNDLISTYNRFSAQYYGHLTQAQILTIARDHVRFCQRSKEIARERRARRAAHQLHPTPLEAVQNFIADHTEFGGTVAVTSYIHGKHGYSKKETCFTVTADGVKQIARRDQLFNTLIDIRAAQLEGVQPSINIFQARISHAVTIAQRHPAL